MSSSRKALATLLLAAFALPALAQDKFPGIGRAATPKEVAAWDIDVRPDFKGLPPGSGSVAAGQDIWESKCASCHGFFAESNSVFTPLVGGTTAEDVKTGRVANLTRTDYPGRTSLMKVPTVSTLWDYINRAMPWDRPKSLKPDVVYAVTAFLLNLAHVVPENFTLSDKNIAEVQQKMPNRNGMTTAHAMWPGKELNGTAKPDVVGTACMTNCPELKISSRLPEHARDAHGNLREQNRTVGPQRGSDTSKAEGKPGADPLGDLASARAAAAGQVDPFDYYVQAGAFRNQQDADAQRAKLAMLGWEARVSEREQNGRNVYRVRIGPFAKRDDADQLKEKLAGAGVESALVRVQR